MKRMTFLTLVAALVLAVLAIPLLFTFTPAGISCCVAAMLLVVLAVPDLSSQDGQTLETARALR